MDWFNQVLGKNEAFAKLHFFFYKKKKCVVRLTDLITIYVLENFAERQ